MAKAAEEKVVMTREGYDKLKAELVSLRSDGRSEVAAKLEEARGFGDLSENAEYHAAKEEQEKIENRIMMLEYQLSKAQIVEDDEIDTSTASLGTTVTLKDTDLKKTFVYKLVGTEEADIKENKISISSPIARALIGKYAGDIAEVQAPGGVREYEILDVRYV